MFLAIGAAALLQDRRGAHFTGNWSFVPYADRRVGLFVAAALAGRRRKRDEEGQAVSPKPKTATPPEKVTRDDIEAKLRELRGEVDSASRRSRCRRSRSRSASSVVTVVAAYWFGRRKGKKRQTILEIRRI